MLLKILILTIIFNASGAAAKIPASKANASSPAFKLQQQRQITGKVTDEEGQPIPGVSVSLKGTTIAASTNALGIYQIAAPAGGTLVFSSTGLERQEIQIGTSSTINATMKTSVTEMDEVVVVGYGTQKKETLSGAISQIRGADIQTTKTESLVSNMQGKVAGVQIRQNTAEPGSFDSNVSIRGFGTPLVIIDGVPRDGINDLGQLNSDDVESISVLKDGAAAIYGMNSANGVILVTTKKGVAAKPKFTYTTLLGTKGATGMESTIDAYSYRLMKNEMDRNLGTGAALTYNNDILEKYRTKQPGYEDTDWIGLTLYDQVFQQQHNLAVRGGTDKSRYYTSFAYVEDDGLLKSDVQKYRRYNLRATSSSDLSDNVTMNVSFAGRLDNTRSPRDQFIWVFKPIMVNDRGQNYHTIANENHMTALPPENTNPFAMMSPDIDGYRYQSDRQYQTTLDFTYKVPFVKGLTATALGAYDVNTRNESLLQKAFDQYDYYTDAKQSTFGTNRVVNFMDNTNRMYVRGQLGYQTKIGNHNISALAATELIRTRRDRLDAARQYTDIYTTDILNQGTATTATNAGFREFTGLAAYLSRVNYDYKGKYLLEGTVRYDGSYRYAPSKRWAFFPSGSAGWRISEEPFFKNNVKFVSDLKLRASYGASGRDAGNAYQYISAYTLGNSSGSVLTPGQLTVGAAAPGVVNDNLSWVEVKIADIGLDIGLLKGKLNATIDVFDRRSTGLLAARIQNPPIPNTFGASLPNENVNSEANRGIEFSISHNGKIGSEFTYTVSANTTYSRFKILHQERAAFTSSFDRWRNGNENRYAGRLLNYNHSGRYTSLAEYETAPLSGGAQGNSKMLPGSYKLIDVNGDGVINDADQTFNTWAFGDINPPLQYGMTLGGKYKMFDINVLFQGASLYSINYRNNDIWGYGRYPSLQEKFLDRWHTTNPTDNPFDPATVWVPGYYPALRTNFNNTTEGNRIDVWTPPATFVRLKSLEVGYNLPKSVLSRLRISNLRVYANGFNLFTITRRELKNADPERQEKDFDANLTYPLMKSYNMGINLTF